MNLGYFRTSFVLVTLFSSISVFAGGFAAPFVGQHFYKKEKLMVSLDSPWITDCFHGTEDQFVGSASDSLANCFIVNHPDFKVDKYGTHTKENTKAMVDAANVFFTLMPKYKCPPVGKTANQLMVLILTAQLTRPSEIAKSISLTSLCPLN